MDEGNGCDCFGCIINDIDEALSEIPVNRIIIHEAVYKFQKIKDDDRLYNKEQLKWITELTKINNFLEVGDYDSIKKLIQVYRMTSHYEWERDLERTDKEKEFSRNEVRLKNLVLESNKNNWNLMKEKYKMQKSLIKSMLNDKGKT